MTRISLSLTRAVEVPFVPKNPSTWADGLRVGILERGGGGGGWGEGGRTLLRRLVLWFAKYCMLIN